MSNPTRIRVNVSVAVALVLVAAGPVAAVPQDPSAAVTVVRRCLVEFEHNTVVSPPILGLLTECLVEHGTRVKAGQVLGRLQDDEARAEFRLRELEANSDAGVRLAEAKTCRGGEQDAADRGTRPPQRREPGGIPQRRARSQGLGARSRAGDPPPQARPGPPRTRPGGAPEPRTGQPARRRRRRRHPPEGETVAPRDTVFQVVDTEQIRVVGQVDVTEVWRLKVGQAVRVIPEVAGADLPVEHMVFPGRLTFIDSHIDPATRTCKIHVSTENLGGHLRAGMEARIEIDPEPPPERPPAVPQGGFMSAVEPPRTGVE